jgi:ArsR family transcriptional regulator, lead/cadmium/zinc/bismuth-responsive transcriptional repressor
VADQCDLLCLDLDRAEAVRAMLPSPAAIEESAAQARALADPTRLTIAAALRDGELCGCDVAWVIGRAQNLISHHLKTLREAGLVSSRREGKMVFFALTDDGLDLLSRLLEEPVPA